MRLRLLAAAVLAAAIPGVAPAQDARRGADLAAQSCTACHGENGRSETADIPSLAGQPEDFITLQMILFREGIRRAPPTWGGCAVSWTGGSVTCFPACRRRCWRRC